MSQLAPGIEKRLDSATAEFHFDIPRLGRRVAAAVDWASDPRT